MNDLFAALQRNNQNTGGAYIEKGPQRRAVDFSIEEVDVAIRF